jgi:hypothetical protein
LEQGNNAEDYAFGLHTVILFGVLALGVMIAAIGMHRAGAAAAAERGAYSAAVQQEASAGDAVAGIFFAGFTGKTGVAESESSGRTVTVSIERRWQAWTNLFEPFEAEERGGMNKRVERFYAGKETQVGDTAP